VNTFEALVSLNFISGLGSVRLNRLLEYFAKPEDIFQASFEELVRLGLSAKIAQEITSFKVNKLEAEILSARRLGAGIQTYLDADYPLNLKNITGAPLVLYSLGKVLEEDKSGFAIVGSRCPSIYGLNQAAKFSRELTLRGITIISGLARGIDTYAHRAALRAGGRTIAVLGSGLNQVYPSENMALAKEISRQGAVVSEFPLETMPLACNFPRRNRIISGLSLGVLVAEAAKNSGALITADFALEQGREVFALPGKIDSDTSIGANALIKQGAKLATSCEDILEDLFISFENSKPASSADCVCQNNLSFDKEQSRLYHYINNHPVSIDGLAEKTELKPAQLSGLILSLRLRKLIKELPGKHYIRS